MEWVRARWMSGESCFMKNEKKKIKKEWWQRHQFQQKEYWKDALGVDDKKLLVSLEEQFTLFWVTYSEILK